MNSTSLPQGLWTVNEVAAFLSMSKQWVYKQAELGEIPCVRFGAALRFRPELVQAFMAAREHGPRLRCPSPSGVVTPLK